MGFVKIRHDGLLGNRHKQTRLAHARHLLGGASAPEAKPLPELLCAPPSTPPEFCPFCQRPGLIKVREVPPRSTARFDSS